MRQATIIAISSRLRESSDGFVFCSTIYNDRKITNKIEDTIYNTVEEFLTKFQQLGRYRLDSGETSYHNRDFISAKRIIRFFERFY